MDEKRTHCRREEKRPEHRFLVDLYDSQNLISARAQVADLSLGGIGLADTPTLTHSDSLGLTLHMPDSDVSLTGKIVWTSGESKGNRAGIAFTNVSSVDAQLLSRWTERAPRQLPPAAALSATQLELLRQTSLSFATEFDRTTLLRRIVEQAVRLLGAQSGGI